jgi:hypothetical protein
VTVLISAGSIAACGATADPDQREPEVPTTTVEANTRCEPASFRVTRLPWLARGSEVPPPETVMEEGSTSLVWFEDPERRWDGRYVALQATSEPPFGSDLDGFPTASVRGRVGHLVWVGDPGVGELALTWQEGDASCSWHSLRISGEGLGEDEAVSQLRQVASSLG